MAEIITAIGILACAMLPVISMMQSSYGYTKFSERSMSVHIRAMRNILLLASQPFNKLQEKALGASENILADSEEALKIVEGDGENPTEILDEGWSFVPPDEELGGVGILTTTIQHRSKGKDSSIKEYSLSMILVQPEVSLIQDEPLDINTTH